LDFLDVMRLCGGISVLANCVHRFLVADGLPAGLPRGLQKWILIFVTIASVCARTLAMAGWVPRAVSDCGFPILFTLWSVFAIRRRHLMMTSAPPDNAA
jgi:hypothetical protein